MWRAKNHELLKFGKKTSESLQKFQTWSGTIFKKQCIMIANLASIWICVVYLDLVSSKKGTQCCHLSKCRFGNPVRPYHPLSFWKKIKVYEASTANISSKFSFKTSDWDHLVVIVTLFTLFVPVHHNLDVCIATVVSVLRKEVLLNMHCLSSRNILAGKIPASFGASFSSYALQEALHVKAWLEKIEKSDFCHCFFEPFCPCISCSVCIVECVCVRVGGMANACYPNIVQLFILFFWGALLSSLNI